MDAVVPAAGWSVDEVLVGRHSELERLQAQLAAVRSGRPRVVTVEGPAGIGKSALVRHFLSQADDVGVLEAGGEEWEASLPFGVVAQLLAPLEVTDGLEGLGTVGGPAADPLTVGAQLLAVVGGVAGSRPLAIVIDDAQWVDTASVQALSFMLRRLRVDAVLAIVVGRDEGSGVPEPFRRLSSERGTHVRVSGLDVEELRELSTRIGTTLSRRGTNRLAEHSGGSPLYARALLDELGAGPFEALDVALPAPSSYGMVVVGRLAGCSEPSRRLVEAASVLGSACPLGLAAQVGDVPEPLLAADEAVRARLLSVGSGAPGHLRFTHPLTRAAVYHDLGPARRAALHDRAATLVDRDESLIHRVAAAVGADPALAAELEDRARLEAGRGALAIAARHLLDAARLSQDRGQFERLSLDAVEHLLRAGDAGRAASIAVEFDHFADTARRRYLQGHLALVTGRKLEAERLLTEAWTTCDPQADPDVASLVCVDMAQLCGGQMRAAEAAEWSRRAIDTSDHAEVTAAALGVLVPCLGMVGRSADALAALEPFAPAGPEQAPAVVEALLARGTVRLWIDDLPEARSDLATVVDLCRNRPAARPALIALAALADAEYRLGAWDDSLTHASLAVSLAEDSDQRWMGAFVNSAATWVLAPRGDWDRAEAHAAAALEAAHSLGDPMSVFCAAAGRAHVAFVKGEHQRVVDALQPLFDADIESVPEEPGVHPWRHLHAEALLRLGRLPEAEAALEILEHLAEAGSRRSSAAHAGRVRALLEAERGDHAEARARFEAAVADVEQLKTPFEAAQAHDAYGRFLRRLRDRRAAAMHLELALAVYHELGAEPLAAACATELAACGLAPRRRREEDAIALTPQELAVSRLVAAGATNREVASELVVSVKTVEHHLSAVYAKLGVRSRTELAAHLNSRPS